VFGVPLCAANKSSSVVLTCAFARRTVQTGHSKTSVRVSFCDPPHSHDANGALNYKCEFKACGKRKDFRSK
jgi:hypothetical protein